MTMYGTKTLNYGFVDIYHSNNGTVWNIMDYHKNKVIIQGHSITI